VRVDPRIRPPRSDSKMRMRRCPLQAPRLDRTGTNPGILTIAITDPRHELAQCPHRWDLSNPCQVKYVD
jgi:hypothetical protein